MWSLDPFLKPGKRRLFRLHVLSAKGRYPSERIQLRDALFVANGELVYSVVPEERPNIYNHSETAWASLGEIRWWGAISLSLKEGNGFFVFYPGMRGATICAENLREDLAERRARRIVAEEPVGTYDPHWAKLDVDEVAKLYNALFAADDVLLRGVSCYLKSHVLQRDYYLFLEEAGLNLYIALEAALAVLRKRLGANVGRDVSYRDTLQFVAETFSYGPALVEFLEDCRDDRNAMMHPDSEFGRHQLLPMSADDILELFGPMVSLYRYILIGDPRPSERVSS